MVLLLLLSSLLKALTLKFSNRVDIKDQIYVITFLDGNQLQWNGPELYDPPFKIVKINSLLRLSCQHFSHKYYFVTI